MGLIIIEPDAIDSRFRMFVFRSSCNCGIKCDAEDEYRQEYCIG